MARVAGRVALVTGGADGIGLATTRLLLRQGVLVVVADINTARGELAVSDLKASDLGAEAVFVHLDVAAPSAWDAAMRDVEARFGRLDILVNNAGVYTTGPLQDATPEEFARHVAVNQLGVLLGMKSAAGLMRKGSGGAIVNVASTAGQRGGPDRICYRASKWAVRGLTRSAAHDLAPFGIRVNAVLPGPVDTGMIHAGNTAEAVEAMAQGTLLKRLGRPAEIAEAIAFLASDGASYITGAELVVDGGGSA